VSRQISSFTAIDPSIIPKTRDNLLKLLGQEQAVDAYQIGKRAQPINNIKELTTLQNQITLRLQGKPNPVNPQLKNALFQTNLEPAKRLIKTLETKTPLTKNQTQNLTYWQRAIERHLTRQQNLTTDLAKVGPQTTSNPAKPTSGTPLRPQSIGDANFISGASLKPPTPEEAISKSGAPTTNLPDERFHKMVQLLKTKEATASAPQLEIMHKLDNPNIIALEGAGTAIGKSLITPMATAEAILAKRAQRFLIVSDISEANAHITSMKKLIEGMQELKNQKPTLINTPLTVTNLDQFLKADTTPIIAVVKRDDLLAIALHLNETQQKFYKTWTAWDEGVAFLDQPSLSLTDGIIVNITSKADREPYEKIAQIIQTHLNNKKPLPQTQQTYSPNQIKETLFTTNEFEEIQFIDEIYQNVGQQILPEDLINKITNQQPNEIGTHLKNFNREEPEGIKNLTPQETDKLHNLTVQLDRLASSIYGNPDQGTGYLATYKHGTLGYLANTTEHQKITDLYNTLRQGITDENINQHLAQTFQSQVHQIEIDGELKLYIQLNKFELNNLAKDLTARGVDKARINQNIENFNTQLQKLVTDKQLIQQQGAVSTHGSQKPVLNMIPHKQEALLRHIADALYAKVPIDQISPLIRYSKNPGKTIDPQNVLAKFSDQQQGGLFLSGSTEHRGPTLRKAGLDIQPIKSVKNYQTTDVRYEIMTQGQLVTDDLSEVIERIIKDTQETQSGYSRVVIIDEKAYGGHKNIIEALKTQTEDLPIIELYEDYIKVWQQGNQIKKLNNIEVPQGLLGTVSRNDAEEFIQKVSTEGKGIIIHRMDAHRGYSAESKTAITTNTYTIGFAAEQGGQGASRSGRTSDIRDKGIKHINFTEKSTLNQKITRWLKDPNFANHKEELAAIQQKTKQTTELTKQEHLRLFNIQKEIEQQQARLTAFELQVRKFSIENHLKTKANTQNLTNFLETNRDVMERTTLSYKTGWQQAESTLLNEVKKYQGIAQILKTPDTTTQPHPFNNLTTTEFTELKKAIKELPPELKTQLTETTQNLEKIKLTEQPDPTKFNIEETYTKLGKTKNLQEIANLKWHKNAFPHDILGTGKNLTTEQKIIHNIAKKTDLQQNNKTPASPTIAPSTPTTSTNPQKTTQPPTQTTQQTHFNTLQTPPTFPQLPKQNTQKLHIVYKTSQGQLIYNDPLNNEHPVKQEEKKYYAYIKGQYGPLQKQELFWKPKTTLTNNPQKLNHIPTEKVLTTRNAGTGSGNEKGLLKTEPETGAGMKAEETPAHPSEQTTLYLEQLQKLNPPLHEAIAKNFQSGEWEMHYSLTNQTNPTEKTIELTITALFDEKILINQTYQALHAINPDHPLIHQAQNPLHTTLKNQPEKKEQIQKTLTTIMQKISEVTYETRQQQTKAIEQHLTLPPTPTQEKNLAQQIKEAVQTLTEEERKTILGRDEPEQTDEISQRQDITQNIVKTLKTSLIELISNQWQWMQRTQAVSNNENGQPTLKLSRESIIYSPLAPKTTIISGKNDWGSITTTNEIGTRYWQQVVKQKGYLLDRINRYIDDLGIGELTPVWPTNQNKTTLINNLTQLLTSPEDRQTIKTAKPARLQTNWIWQIFEDMLTVLKTNEPTESEYKEFTILMMELKLLKTDYTLTEENKKRLTLLLENIWNNIEEAGLETLNIIYNAYKKEYRTYITEQETSYILEHKKTKPYLLSAIKQMQAGKTDDKGQTALHETATNKDTKTIEKILTLAPKELIIKILKTTDNKNLTPLDHLIESNRMTRQDWGETVTKLINDYDAPLSTEENKAKIYKKIVNDCLQEGKLTELGQLLTATQDETDKDLLKDPNLNPEVLRFYANKKPQALESVDFIKQIVITKNQNEYTKYTVQLNDKITELTLPPKTTVKDVWESLKELQDEPLKKAIITLIPSILNLPPGHHATIYAIQQNPNHPKYYISTDKTIFTPNQNNDPTTAIFDNQLDISEQQANNQLNTNRVKFLEDFESQNTQNIELENLKQTLTLSGIIKTQMDKIYKAEKNKMKKEINQLMAIEKLTTQLPHINTRFQNPWELAEENGNAYYSTSHKEIGLTDKLNFEVIIHELAHALDNQSALANQVFTSYENEQYRCQINQIAVHIVKNNLKEEKYSGNIDILKALIVVVEKLIQAPNEAKTDLIENLDAIKQDSRWLSLIKKYENSKQGHDLDYFREAKFLPYTEINSDLLQIFVMKKRDTEKYWNQWKTTLTQTFGDQAPKILLDLKEQMIWQIHPNNREEAQIIHNTFKEALNKYQDKYKPEKLKPSEKFPTQQARTNYVIYKLNKIINSLQEAHKLLNDPTIHNTIIEYQQLKKTIGKEQQLPTTISVNGRTILLNRKSLTPDYEHDKPKSNTTESKEDPDADLYSEEDPGADLYSEEDPDADLYSEEDPDADLYNDNIPNTTQDWHNAITQTLQTQIKKGNLTLKTEKGAHPTYHLATQQTPTPTITLPENPTQDQTLEETLHWLHDITKAYKLEDNKWIFNQSKEHNLFQTTMKQTLANLLAKLAALKNKDLNTLYQTADPTIQQPLAQLITNAKVKSEADIEGTKIKGTQIPASHTDHLTDIIPNAPNKYKVREAFAALARLHLLHNEAFKRLQAQHNIFTEATKALDQYLPQALDLLAKIENPKGGFHHPTPAHTGEQTTPQTQPSLNMDNQLWLIRKIDQTKTWAKKLTNEERTTIQQDIVRTALPLSINKIALQNLLYHLGLSTEQPTQKQNQIQALNNLYQDETQWDTLVNETLQYPALAWILQNYHHLQTEKTILDETLFTEIEYDENGEYKGHKIFDNSGYQTIQEKEQPYLTKLEITRNKLTDILLILQQDHQPETQIWQTIEETISLINEEESANEILTKRRKRNPDEQMSQSRKKAIEIAELITKNVDEIITNPNKTKKELFYQTLEYSLLIELIANTPASERKYLEKITRNITNELKTIETATFKNHPTGLIKREFSGETILKEEYQNGETRHYFTQQQNPTYTYKTQDNKHYYRKETPQYKTGYRYALIEEDKTTQINPTHQIIQHRHKNGTIETINIERNTKETQTPTQEPEINFDNKQEIAGSIIQWNLEHHPYWPTPENKPPHKPNQA